MDRVGCQDARWFDHVAFEVTVQVATVRAPIGAESHHQKLPFLPRPLPGLFYGRPGIGFTVVRQASHVGQGVVVGFLAEEFFEQLVILVLQQPYLVLQLAQPCLIDDDPTAKLQRNMVGKQSADEYRC